MCPDRKNFCQKDCQYIVNYQQYDSYIFCRFPPKPVFHLLHAKITPYNVLIFMTCLIFSVFLTVSFRTASLQKFLLSLLFPF